MYLKRVLTSVIGLPLVIAVLILGNKYVVDVLFMLVAIICMREYFYVTEKVSHPMKIVGYLSTIIIALVSIFSEKTIMEILLFGIPIIMLILFTKVIITNMKTTFKDVAYTLVGIFYITFFIMFLSFIRGLDNGLIILGYTLIIAWSTDIFAYLTGRKIGKHKFSKVSPKKTIEGCVGGIIGAVVVGLIYTYIISVYYDLGISNIYLWAIPVSAILSIISQIGDFTASSIKRFADVKDYGNLLPGHGGMLDRIDSVIFIAPFVYMIFFYL